LLGPRSQHSSPGSAPRRAAGFAGTRGPVEVYAGADMSDNKRHVYALFDDPAGEVASHGGRQVD
jgi:hypothetical protein